jgi:uncharacterized protein (TIGR00251 family)
MVDGLQDNNSFFNKVSETQILLFVKLMPYASANEIIGKQKNLFYEELKIKIKSLPIDGKANKELVSFLASELGSKISEIKIIKGLTSTHKTLSLIPSKALEDNLLKLATELPYLN